jgi:hypothetical protein
MIANVLTAWGYVLLFFAVPLVGLLALAALAALFAPGPKRPPYRLREDPLVRFVVWLFRRSP